MSCGVAGVHGTLLSSASSCNLRACSSDCDGAVASPQLDTSQPARRAPAARESSTRDWWRSCSVEATAAAVLEGIPQERRARLLSEGLPRGSMLDDELRTAATAALFNGLVTGLADAAALLRDMRWSATRKRDQTPFGVPKVPVPEDL